MYFVRVLMAGALAALVPIAATAQTRVDPDPDPQEWTDRVESHWLASGFVGSNFANDADEASVDFGGSLGYLWRGVLGVEFQANFAPEFDLEPGRSALLQGEQPWINSYMFNAISAVPLGDEGRFQPYVSGGLGALTLRADVLDAVGADVDPDDSRFGGNIGFGVLGFANNNVGIRGDVRYFTGFQEELGDDIESPEELVGSQVLSDLNFWRANIGVAFRW